jgi:hypothetical protein
MIDSVFEGGSDLRSSEAEAQPLRPARKSNPAEALDHVGVLVVCRGGQEATTLSPEDAKGHIGETATVCGVVVSIKSVTTSLSHPTYLAFGKPYPDAVFTAVIFASDRAKFGTLETSLQGKQICVTGHIGNNLGKPEIIVSDPSQLTE